MDYHKELSANKFSIFIAPRTQIHTHSHDFLELAYVLKGEAIHTLDNSTITIKEGNYFVIDYHSKHSYQAKTDKFEIANCLFLPEFIDSSLVNCRSLKTLISNYQIHFKDEFFTASPSVSLFEDDDKKIRNLLCCILKEYEEKSPGYLQIIRSQIIEILILTMRKIYFDPKNDTENSDINRILKYINCEYMNNLTLGDICKKFGYSFSYMSAKFKKETGENFTKYLQKIRAEQSIRLLANTDLSVTEVAEAVGYHDIKSFYATFKKYADTTPSEFRKYHRQ